MEFKYTGFFKDDARKTVGNTRKLIADINNLQKLTKETLETDGSTRKARIKKCLADLDKKIPELERRLCKRKEAKTDTSLNFGQFVKESWKDIGEIADAGAAIDDLKRERKKLEQELASCESEERARMQKGVDAETKRARPAVKNDSPILTGCLAAIMIPNAVLSWRNCFFSLVSLIGAIVAALAFAALLWK